MSTIASTIALMGQQLQATFRQLQQLEPGSELADAFQNADACKSLSA